MNEKEIISATEKWVETFVIKLNICPFAKREFVSKRIRYAVSQAAEEEALLQDLHAELGKAMLSINAVKGFEYGSGFCGARRRARNGATSGEV